MLTAISRPIVVAATVFALGVFSSAASAGQKASNTERDFTR
jgi:hypothetical protein